ncbi:hypothetical protein LJY25_21145, partial [Hymenobacter sp. BT175]|uniref:hypothetical protein n=1 Tax=Hymenobacter translucens TaxID=2886507 RepID=UPI001D0ED457
KKDLTNSTMVSYLCPPETKAASGSKRKKSLLRNLERGKRVCYLCSPLQSEGGKFEKPASKNNSKNFSPRA